MQQQWIGHYVVGHGTAISQGTAAEEATSAVVGAAYRCRVNKSHRPGRRQPWCVRQQTEEIAVAAAGAARRFHDSNSRRLGWPPAVVQLRQELQVCTAKAWDFLA